jgi:hypothetical protein
MTELVKAEFGGLRPRYPFSRLDADLYAPALIEGVLGAKRWMAERVGAAGGRTRSAGKAAATRENGKRGGRPRRSPTRRER